MKVVGFGPKSRHDVHIPKYLILESGETVFLEKPCPTGNTSPCDLELPEDKWIYCQRGSVYHFSKAKILDVRRNLFTEVHATGSSLSPSQRIDWLYEMAGILELDLLGLLSFLNESKKADENITQAFFRLVKKQ